MRELYVSDIGDGLCLLLESIGGDTIMIDWGTSDGSRKAYETIGCRHFFHEPAIFVLSHFHLDHYNGLLYASKQVKSSLHSVERVFYPRIPAFPQATEVHRAIFAMNMIIFGKDTGLMEYDFFKAVSRLNGGKPFLKESLFKDKEVRVDGSSFKILWPPDTIWNAASAAVKEALGDFNEAKKAYPLLEKAYEQISQDGFFQELHQDGWYEHKTDEFKKQRSESNKGNLPTAVLHAIESLKKVANRLGLALLQDDRFLFLGDLEEEELLEVAKALKAEKRKSFLIMLTAHHGTHWEDSLKELNCNFAITSNGKKLTSGLRQEYKEISRRSIATLVVWLNSSQYGCHTNRKILV